MAGMEWKKKFKLSDIAAKEVDAAQEMVEKAKGWALELKRVVEAKRRHV
jgi:hypothetical protein